MWICLPVDPDAPGTADGVCFVQDCRSAPLESFGSSIDAADHVELMR